jgi:hypothetical protein
MTKPEIRMSQIRRGGTKEIPKHEARSTGSLLASFGSFGHSCFFRPAAADLRHSDFVLRRRESSMNW